MQDNYLDMILSKLHNRIDELNLSIGEGEKDICEMHEYYWDNYTEMDEYGYENFDNRQALLTRINANSQALDLKRRFLKMLDSPYFGRVDFTYEDEDKPESYYIGIGNFSDGAGGTPLIVDWRAPVSSLFYDFDKGSAFFETPEGRLDGEINSKWQYKIKNGRLVYAFESDVTINDDILKSELGNNADVKLKNIVSTIQREQNSIIRNVSDRILLVQGAAGSGKTSIALHRIAYLLYHDRKNLKASNVLILSPNGVFSDYISHILPELGEENIKEMSFDIFAYHELKEIAGDCEEKFDQIERLLEAERSKAAEYEEMAERYSYKQSPGYVNEINGYVLELESDLMNFKDIHYKFVSKSKEDILNLFYYKFPDIPLLSRMDAVAEYVIDEAETLNGRNLDDIEMAIIMESFRGMYETQDIYKLYNSFLKKMKLMALPDEKAAGKLLYEDVYPMLYLKYKLLLKNNKRQIKHVVIDEMQDYTYIQYLIIKQLFDCRMTILGDRAQSMTDASYDVCSFLPKIFGKDIRKLVINKSYRQTVEIAEYACSISGDTDIELLDRHGKPPVIHRGMDEERALSDIAEGLINDDGGFDTFAVLSLSEEEAYRFYKRLCEYLPGDKLSHRLSYVDRDSKEFKKGVIVTTYYLAKGLEFDRVYCMCDKNMESPLLKQAKYIMATRALHELYVYENGE